MNGEDIATEILVPRDAQTAGTIRNAHFSPFHTMRPRTEVATKRSVVSSKVQKIEDHEAVLSVVHK